MSDVNKRTGFGASYPGVVYGVWYNSRERQETKNLQTMQQGQDLPHLQSSATVASNHPIKLSTVLPIICF